MRTKLIPPNAITRQITESTPLLDDIATTYFKAEKGRLPRYALLDSTELGVDYDTRGEIVLTLGSNAADPISMNNIQLIIPKEEHREDEFVEYATRFHIATLNYLKEMHPELIKQHKLPKYMATVKITDKKRIVFGALVMGTYAHRSEELLPHQNGISSKIGFEHLVDRPTFTDLPETNQNTWNSINQYMQKNTAQNITHEINKISKRRLFGLF